MSDQHWMEAESLLICRWGLSTLWRSSLLSDRSQYRWKFAAADRLVDWQVVAPGVSSCRERILHVAR